jgi:crotonobetainyl-CoA:carnitine CoA-transferase CaiB-like acyl-CoA transferase
LRASDVMARLQAVGVPAAAVATSFDLLSDAQLHAHDFVQIVLQPGWEPLFVEGSCFRSVHLEPAPPDPAPRHGEHTREIATDVLGVDDARLDDLVRAHVLELPTEPADAVSGPAR